MNDPPGCGLHTRHDIRVARVWTFFTAFIFSAGTVTSWFTDNWTLRIACLAIPLLFFAMVHIAGMLTWRYQVQTRETAVAAYGQNNQIAYIDDEQRDPLLPAYGTE